MKIKRTVKMRLDELVEHVWDNKICSSTFTNNNGGVVHFNSVGKFCTANSFISPHSTFTVETEEELTRTTKLSKLTEVYYDNEDEGFYVQEHGDESIEYILDQNNATFSTSTLAIFYGKTIIWSAEHGVPAEGVIEV